ncbi:MAG: heme peroxidase, partial [Pyrinomonadaceae bacterium]
KLRVGKATQELSGKNPPLVEVSSRFRNNAPLWFYVLAEAQQAFENNSTPIRLGPVGGRIVGEVIVGLLLGDDHSFLHSPGWTPLTEFNGAKFDMAELIHQTTSR